MAEITKINGTYTSSDLDRLALPIAWAGAPDREYEASLSDLIGRAREALDTTPGSEAVRIEAGEVVVVVDDDGADKRAEYETTAECLRCGYVAKRSLFVGETEHSSHSASDQCPRCGSRDARDIG